MKFHVILGIYKDNSDENSEETDSSTDSKHFVSKLHI
jgi:hypothetical protein